MNLVKLLNCLEFEDHEIIDAEIDAKAALDEHAAIPNGERELPLNFEAPIQQFEFQTGLVRGFE